MSITTSSILLYLLCLSFHVCNARHLGAITKESEKQFLLSSKSDEKVGPVKIFSISGPKVKPTLWNDELGVGNGEKMLKESEVREDDNSKPIHLKADQKELKDHNRVKVSGYAQSESLASVSWHAPHRKRKEQQPEFNSDYSIPKTHPPVHN